MKTEFTLNFESKEIKYLKQEDAILANVIDHVGSITYRLYDDSFVFLVDTIIGQMLSNKVADTISARFRGICGDIISPKSVSMLSVEKLRSIGLSMQKSGYILSLSNYVMENPDFFDKIAALGDSDAINLITQQRGLGCWSAKMYLIFVLNRMDILPYEDGAFLQVYKHIYNTEDIKPKNIILQCSCWKPYSSIAARYMYRFLDSGYMIK